MKMTSRQILDSVHRALAEVDRRLASGELDGSGRFYTDKEVAAGVATGGRKSELRPKSSRSKSKKPAA